RIRIDQPALFDVGVAPLDQQARMLALEQRPGNSASPEVDPFARVFGDLVMDDDVRDLQPSAWPQHSVDLVEYRLLVGDEVNHPVGDDEIDGGVLDRE